LDHENAKDSDKLKYSSSYLATLKTNLKKDNTLFEKAINHILSSVSERNIETWINHITSFHTRHTKSKFINQIAQWLKNELESFGYKDVYFHNFTEDGYSLKNVICQKQGRSNKVMIICAHYDCRMEDLENAEARSPGADDNASGISSLLELSRIIAQLDLEDSIQFAFFSGEEQGRWGSEKYASYIKESSVNLHRLINLDMVGHPFPNQKQIVIERDRGNVVSFNDEDSEGFAKIIEHMALDFTDLQVVAGPIYKSDYMPFEALGYVVAGLYDGSDADSSYHSKNDIPSNLDIGYIASVTKTVLATILYETRIQLV